MAISKSIELFVDTYCHTMLGDREAFLSHGRISRIGILVDLVDITTITAFYKVKELSEKEQIIKKNKKKYLNQVCEFTCDICIFRLWYLE